jgi:hypothetical protein
VRALEVSPLTLRFRRDRRQVAGRRHPAAEFSYETPWVNVCIWLKSAASIAGFVLKSEAAEYRITNFEGLNRCALSIVFIVIARIPSFDIRPARNALNWFEANLTI